MSGSLNLHHSVRLLCGLSLEEEPINIYLDPREASDSESDEIVKCVVYIRRMYEIVLMEYEVGLPPPKTGYIRTTCKGIHALPLPERKNYRINPKFKDIER